jgi:hypothetical protein
MPFNKGDIIALEFEMPDTGRCHLITYVREIHIKSDNGNPFNKLKSQALERLLAHINVAVFDN